MNITFVSQFDPNDIRPWSGTIYHMARALEDSQTRVRRVGPLREPMPWLWTAKHAFYRLLLRRSYGRDREPAVLRSYARQAAADLSANPCDAVLSPSSSPIAHLSCREPVYLWTDAVFPAMLDFYYRNLAAETVRKGMAMEREALKRCRLAIFSSEWAARSAIEQCGCDAGRVKVVPFGANIECSRTAEDVERLIQSRPGDCCRLLLVGVDWHRKGCAMAVAIAREMNRLGLPTTLTIVGCRPDGADAGSIPPEVRIIDFISKQSPQGRQQLDQLFSQAHFMLLPSRAETYGVALVEANSFGVPCLASRVGGIPTIIREGVNGHTFDLSVPAGVWAERAVQILSNRDGYEQMARAAFAEYQTRLNWSSAAGRVRELIGQSLR